jgi:hypothetical protein
MDRTQLVSRIAYSLFEHRGAAHGRDLDDWFCAELLVSVCLEAGAKKRTAPPRQAIRELAAPGIERRALDLLEEAADEKGRAAAAATLGYSSTSVVSALLQGRRALERTLAERILAAFGEESARAA